jgi:hypothetical protein
MISELQTRPERTGYNETSRYADVEAFTDAVAGASPRIHKTYFGYTVEGRALPLLVFGDVDGADPASVLAARRTRVFIQANIHAGEVEGKEAMLMLLRDLAGGLHAHWADSLVILVAPIYNADGNERVTLSNRGPQHGPFGGIGQRTNAQDLDLNRDHMKLDSPEARSLVRMMSEYDPHVAVDLHTTNGTFHAYHLTYSPPLHPNTSEEITQLLRGSWLPDVTRTIREQYGWEFYYYGNVPRRGEPGWYTFDHRPRFNNNYVGLRNRLAILSEAYAYAPFDVRVMSSLHFVEEILEYAHAHAGHIRGVVERADDEDVRGQTLALAATFERSADPVEILMGEVVETRNPFSGARMLKRADVIRPERMYEYGTFAPTESDIVPSLYFVPQEQSGVVNRLRDHGIRSRILDADSTLAVERFRIDSVQVAEREYQGRVEHDLVGIWEEAEVTLPAGTVVVDVGQSLGRLVFALLEPRSDDGFLNWGVVDLGDDPDYYPIIRVPHRSGR